MCAVEMQVLLVEARYLDRGAVYHSSIAEVVGIVGAVAACCDGRWPTYIQDCCRGCHRLFCVLFELGSSPGSLQ